jgi:hypothetical protein
MDEVQDEGCKVGGEPDRFLTIEGMSGTMIYH